jgi:carboxymethylenebutenolidase
MAEWVQISGPDGTFKAYVARPSGTPKAGVVVLQEIFGVNAVVRGKADWLAREGFLAVAPDLFWRIEPGVDITDKTEAEWAKAMDLMDKFVKLGVGTKDIAATIAATRKMGVSKVGDVGYCLGGLLAYRTACNTDADASVGYYGVNIPAFLEEAKNIKKPLMLHIAGKDGFVKKQAQDAMHKGLGSNPLVTLYDYPERDHAFTREGGKNYDATDAKIADDRTIAFFNRHLA